MLAKFSHLLDSVGVHFYIFKTKYLSHKDNIEIKAIQAISVDSADLKDRRNSSMGMTSRKLTEIGYGSIDKFIRSHLWRHYPK